MLNVFIIVTNQNANVKTTRFNNRCNVLKITRCQTMATSLKNQIALVTGTASGISHAYTKYLLQNRVKVRSIFKLNYNLYLS